MRSLARLAAVLLLSTACGPSETEVNGDAAVWMSEDGTTWSRVLHPALDGPGDQQMTAVTVFGETLVAVGINRLGGEVDGRVWLSEDGVEWMVITDAALGGPGEQWMWSVVEAGPGLIAVGATIKDGNSDAAVWTSSDGIEWARVTDPDLGGPGHQSIGAITVFGETIIAAGSDAGSAAIWTSLDGTTWSKIADSEVFGGEGQVWISDLATGGPGVVAVGSDGTNAAVWTSSDGSRWSKIDNPEVFGGDGVQEMLSIIGWEQGLVAVGSTTAYERIYFLGRGAETITDAAVWTSEDGLFWSRVHSPDLGYLGDQVMFTVTAWGSGLVAAGIDLSDPRSGAVFGADHDSGQDVDAAAWLSTDGLIWSKIRSPALGGDDWQDIFEVIAFGDKLVAVGGDDLGSTLGVIETGS